MWTRFDGYLQVVRDAWVCPLVDADPRNRVLDCKLRSVAGALQSWSMRNLSSIRLQIVAGLPER
jgi:hypothetical protein